MRGDSRHDFYAKAMALCGLGMLAGVGTAAVLNATGQLFLWTAFWSFVAASATLLVVSAVTTPKSDDELRGLVCWVR